MPGKPIFTIRRSSGWRLLDLRELWAYRELIYFLTWRDIKVRYKQTAIGIAWIILQPLALLAVFTWLFGRLAQIPSEGVPYPVFALAGLLPWQAFSRIISESSNSLITDQRLISRVYFPRIIVPLASSLVVIFDLLISSALLFGIVLFYNVPISPFVVWLPIFALLMLMTGLGIAFWLSALNVEYRDVIYTIPFLTQLWFFITPVVYPASFIPERWRLLYGLNPMTGVIGAFRWSLLGIGESPGLILAVSMIVSAVMFLTGIVWFRNRERTFVDAIGSGGR
jgi:lipopolysaccharide transport system permease protein